MRFLMTVNGGGAPPEEQLFAEMGRFVEELTRAGVLLATGGLDRGTHVTSSGGNITLTDGPFTESKEVIVSFALIEVLWRIESARIIAGLAGLVRDVGLAEELAQDALVAALEQWPAEGIPPNPGAWLMVTAKHRAIDRIRRNERLGDKLSLLGRELETQQLSAPAETEAVLDGDENMGDDLLRLIFISCHPVLS